MEAYVASRILGAYTQYQGDKAQANYINSTSQTKQKNLANEAIYKDNAFIREKEVKEDQLIAQKEDVEEKKLKVLGKANVQFFEKGIGGNIYNTLIGDIERSAGKNLNRIDQNYENYILANSNNRLAWNRKFTNQMGGLKNNITTQKKFLTKMGIKQRAEIISQNLNFSNKADIYYRLNRLIDKKQMGSLFKVMFIKNKKNNFKLGF